MLQAGLKAKKRCYKNMYKNMRFKQWQWNYVSNQINQIKCYVLHKISNKLY